MNIDAPPVNSSYTGIYVRSKACRHTTQGSHLAVTIAYLLYIYDEETNVQLVSPTPNLPYTNKYNSKS